MNSSDHIRRLIVQQLEALRGFGVQQIGALPAATPAAAVAMPNSVPAPTATAYTPTAVPTPRVTTSPSAPTDVMPRKSAAATTTQNTHSLRLLPWDGPLLSRDERLAEFEKMKKEVAGCIACQQLVRNRSRTVFGDGNLMPRIVIFGEAPGADEDREGIPFVGRAGQLLTKIIEACSFKREDVYIMNVLRCRPPDNRKPEPDEVTNCRVFFERQFAVLRPEYIVCVGATPAQALLETTELIGKLRGRFHDYRGSKVVATYHPAYLLRNPDAKKFVWEDMQMMLRDMGIDPAAARK
ncbi:uracil-DNA glycosylase family protein [Anatilimnocola sp. NA78]|uniref:uracil-DNA glycosylase n=1 Tax=Anatilimnocola sp. NA78 TaxID=3415683 RepID=UPI003CE5C184